MHHGVYAAGYAPQSLDAHFIAAVLAGGEFATHGAFPVKRWAKAH